ncbi:MOSC domain-containing protein [Flavimaricola marinus]|uniref:6-N-hydroxylaminopurine resistance protein n=1 Tax=Flavimaricola marinus TaxID=1819565 RepID=A0A238LD32_9RHOB|nr:MOSC domain-containing protein [Flavimaricola marinus]SMY07492.1 6-N-hydroxylaminopurine resistance protein [Flavimaricola marinus]
MPEVLSVNIGQPSAISAKSGQTGHFKSPFEGPVEVGQLGLAGDSIIDTKNHGGFDQAVYLFDQADIEWWAARIDRVLGAGAFGENLTVRGLPTSQIGLGDRLNIAGVELEVTSPRIPCVTLAEVMGDPEFAKQFFAAERCGYYARVLQYGPLSAGDGIVWSPLADPRCPVTDLLPGKDRKPSQISRLLATPLHHKARAELERLPH